MQTDRQTADSDRAGHEAPVGPARARGGDLAPRGLPPRVAAQRQLRRAVRRGFAQDQHRRLERQQLLPDPAWRLARRRRGRAPVAAHGRRVREAQVGPRGRERGRAPDRRRELGQAGRDHALDGQEGRGPPRGHRRAQRPARRAQATARGAHRPQPRPGRQHELRDRTAALPARWTTRGGALRGSLEEHAGRPRPEAHRARIVERPGRGRPLGHERPPRRGCACFP